MHKGRPGGDTDHPHGHHRHHGGGGGGGGEYTRGRRFSSEDLQLILLALVSEKPRHGYELIKELEQRSDGFYAPSPGMVYPGLTYLEEQGYVRSETTGNKKAYSLLPEGQAWLATRRDRVDELLAGLVHMARKMKHLRGAIAEESQADEGVWLPVFIAARLALKRALLLKSAAGPDEQRRVAAILERATQEIAASNPSISSDKGSTP